MLIGSFGGLGDYKPFVFWVFCCCCFGFFVCLFVFVTTEREKYNLKF